MPLKIHADEMPTLNLTSMIDILFLLIIFFMVGTKFTEWERKLVVEVPKIGDVTALAPAPQKQVINVYQDGRISLDRQIMTLAELRAVLEDRRRQYSDLGVVVRGDGESNFQAVADVLGACRQAGITDMGIAVRLARKGE